MPGEQRRKLTATQQGIRPLLSHKGQPPPSTLFAGPLYNENFTWLPDTAVIACCRCLTMESFDIVGLQREAVGRGRGRDDRGVNQVLCLNFEALIPFQWACL